MPNSSQNSERHIVTFVDSEPTSDDNALAALQDELERVKNGHNEERFIWVLVFTVILDAHIFSYVESTGGAIVIGLIQLIAVIILARKWQIEEIPQLIARLVDRANNNLPS